MFLMDNRQANRDWDSCLETLKTMLAKHGGEVQRLDKWGERRLAYEIKGRRRGTYVLTYFTATGTAVTDIYRECELSELMLRALILKVEKIPETTLFDTAPEPPFRSRHTTRAREAEETPAASEKQAEETAE
jgi:small subunit ribosomal protein S6